MPIPLPETSSANILLRLPRRLGKLAAANDLQLMAQSEIDQASTTSNEVVYEALVRDMLDTMPDGFDKFARDTPELAGAMAVWLSTDEASFLNGRFVSSTWPIDELEARKEEILAGGDLKTGLQGKFVADA